MGFRFPAMTRSALATAVLLAGASNAVAESFSYANVAGSSFRPRDAATVVAYQAAGCISRSSGSDYLVYPLQLPEASRIKYLRMYYRDTSSASLTLALTRYDGAGNFFDDVVFQNTNANSGYGSVQSGELNTVVNNTDYATQLLVNFGESSTTLQFCGARVAYYADALFANGFDP